MPSSREFGTVTGRERRCGWLDLVALRYAARINGFTSLALTKLDVLSSFSELPVCVRYRLRDGTETADFPSHQGDFHHAAPVYEVLAGWSEPIDDVAGFEDLPDAARSYVEFVENSAWVSNARRHGRRARARADAPSGGVDWSYCYSTCPMTVGRPSEPPARIDVAAGTAFAPHRAGRVGAGRGGCRARARRCTRRRRGHSR